MSDRFDKALMGLRDTYPAPDPARREEFLRSIREQEHRPAAAPLFRSSRKPLWFAIPAAAAAVVMLTVGVRTFRQNPPHQIPGVETTTSFTETASQETVTQTVTQASGTLPPATQMPETESTETVPAVIPAATVDSAAVTAQPARQTAGSRTQTEQPASRPAVQEASAAIPTQAILPTRPAETYPERPAQTNPKPARTTAQTAHGGQNPPTDPVHPATQASQTARTTMTTRTTTHPTTRPPAQTTTTTSTTRIHTTRTGTTRTEPSTAVFTVPPTTVFVPYTTAGTYATHTGTQRIEETGWFTTTSPEPYTICSTAPLYTTYMTETTAAVMTTDAQLPGMDPTAPAPTDPAPQQPTETTAWQRATYTTAVLAVQYDKPEQAIEWVDRIDYEPAPGLWWLDQADSATDILTGRIVNVRYTRRGYYPYTAIDIEVQDVFRGRTGGTLTVLEPGGYILANDYAVQDYDFREMCYTKLTEAQRAAVPFAHVRSTALPDPVPGQTALFFLWEDPERGYYLPAGSPHLSTLFPDGTQFVSADGAYCLNRAELEDYLE